MIHCMIGVTDGRAPIFDNFFEADTGCYFFSEPVSFEGELRLCL